MWFGRTCAAARTCRTPATSRPSRSSVSPPPTGVVYRGEPDQLQRIYGTAWATKEDLEGLPGPACKEAAERDHRKLGAEMDLFSFPDEIGPGLAVFHPKGAAVINAMEDYSREMHRKHHYSFVQTPHITKGGLYETSGHLHWYKDSMYPPMRLDEEKDEDGNVTKPGADYYLKPMNCPMHNLIFKSAPALLPRAAAAPLRVRHRVPLREVRRSPRPDPRARLHAGRLPHLTARREQASEGNPHA